MSTNTAEQIKSGADQRADFLREYEDARALKRKEKQRERNKENWAKHGPAINEKKRQERKALGVAPPKKLSKDERRYRASDYQHKAKYGITLEDKKAMLAAQGGGCAICKRTIFGKRAPHTDHCHKTGKVRGVLCARCNHGLGYFWDNPELFRTAAAYLERDQ